ncbi:hypothetical protein [Pendulispora albinea]|uniref:Uncharacterized protein n=1 Tax=Pendulispora albinea TaxID=2741071 RepID=A0ABZ2LRU7_9BACT
MKVDHHTLSSMERLTGSQVHRESRRAVEDVTSRFERLIKLTATPGWDEIDSEPISVQRWEQARRLVATIQDEVPLVSQAVPSAAGDGAIHIRWSLGDEKIFDVELSADGEIAWLTRDDGFRETGIAASLEDMVVLLRAFSEEA